MLTLAGLGAMTSAALLSPPAQAAGCGGYVNVWVTGCAPWDNNARRMPGAPGYVAPRAAAPTSVPQQPRIATPPATGNRFISTNGGNLIGNDSAGLRGRSGIISDNSGGLVGNAGGTMRR